MYHTFKAMKIWNNPRSSAETEPYLHQYYNVRGLHDTSPFSKENVSCKIINALIKKLNETQHLPRMLVIIPDGDLLHSYDHFEYGTSTVIGRCIDGLITQIDAEIDGKKNALKYKRPGVISLLEPKIIWVRMLNRPGVNKILNLREKFNAILEQCLAESRTGYIMDPSAELLQRNMFDRRNNITHEGWVIYWRHINMKLKQFDLKQEGAKDMIPWRDAVQRLQMEKEERNKQERRSQINHRHCTSYPYRDALPKPPPHRH